MRPGREMDTEIARDVFGYRVWAQAKVLFENAPKGDRPLRNYSKEMEWAWEVAEKMKITLIPVEGGQWFAFSGPPVINQNGWESPQAVLKFLDAGNFEGCGAAVGENAAQVICEAALKAAEKRKGVPAAQPETPLSAADLEAMAADAQKAIAELTLVTKAWGEQAAPDEPVPDQDERH